MKKPGPWSLWSYLRSGQFGSIAPKSRALCISSLGFPAILPIILFLCCYILAAMDPGDQFIAWIVSKSFSSAEKQSHFTSQVRFFFSFKYWSEWLEQTRSHIILPLGWCGNRRNILWLWGPRCRGLVRAYSTIICKAALSPPRYRRDWPSFGMLGAEYLLACLYSQNPLPMDS